eukprot:CAMPEP_0202690574 /NCGR_PEP_ID=MMETSP1385-20130828/5520_1 /ASSEMBLY_ACC=CAM_ASM_000861 /TAXON_ID=933848 /ORGANISM="Elphidium margaritaceum" /LENGTH=552 /DNA_ID=CAMNT_0049345849 /DNA_START=16 /DNA_END=1674 /DNA_ORIENTATION=+
MTDPLTDLDNDCCCSIFSFLTLLELQTTVRLVCKNWRDRCEEFKQLWIQLLTNVNRKVEILSLQSAKGKSLNGRIGRIVHKTNNNQSQRFSVSLVNYITGKTDFVALKPCNLNPFYYRIGEEDDEQLKLIADYTSNSRLLVSHGMLLDQILMLARWFCSNIEGTDAPKNFADFFQLPRQSKVLGRLNSTLFTWWKTDPRLASRCADGPVLDCVVKSLAHQEVDLSTRLATNDKLWPSDGPGGKYMARNFCHFMKTWDVERITGEFWVVRVYPTGTVLVKIDDEHDKYGSLGKVYLVKGHASVVGELFPSLPHFCRTTLLPVYNCLTYDGMVTVRAVTVTARLENALNQHVNDAIHNKIIVWRGQSAEQGKWDVPPPIPKIDLGPPTRMDNINQNNNDNASTPSCNISDSEWKLGRKVARLAKRRGAVDPAAMIIFRRDGYSYKENPNGMVTTMYFKAGNCMGMLPSRFHVDHSRPDCVPTYSLKEALEILLQSLKQTPHRMPTVQPDEKTVVQPLQTILTETFQKEGVQGEPHVIWYPPPSKEEADFATRFG